MGRKAADYTDREREQDYKFQCILYPDATDYDCEILKNRLSSFWDHSLYILHDKDYYNETDVEEWQAAHKSEECPFKEGELKKPHYHVVAWCKSPILLGNAANKFGIESNYIQRVKSLKAAIRYLVHKDNPGKYQYDISAITRNDVEEKELAKYLKIDCDSMEKGKKLFDFILAHEQLSLSELIKFSLENECYDELRRGQHLFTSVMIERNSRNDYQR